MYKKTPRPKSGCCFQVVLIRLISAGDHHTLLAEPHSFDSGLKSATLGSGSPRSVSTLVDHVDFGSRSIGVFDNVNRSASVEAFDGETVCELLERTDGFECICHSKNSCGDLPRCELCSTSLLVKTQYTRIRIEVNPYCKNFRNKKENLLTRR